MISRNFEYILRKGGSYQFNIALFILLLDTLVFIQFPVAVARNWLFAETK